jgi:hypothetical protein
MVFGTLWVPTGWAPKAREVAERLTAVPMPRKLTLCGLLGSLSAMTRVAASAPVALGLNVKLIVQLPSPATLPPATHVELDRIVKSPASVPVAARGEMLTTVTPEMVSGVLPRFLRVTALGALLLFTSCAPKLSVVAESFAAIPVPLRLTLCGLLAALSLIESVAVRLPEAEGVKATLTPQEPLGITVAPVQVSVLLPKSLAFVPVSPTLAIVRFPVPLLVTVSVWAALVVPSS